MSTKETVDRILADTIDTMLAHLELFPIAKYIDGYARTMGNSDSDTTNYIKYVLIHKCGIRKVVEQAVSHTDALWWSLDISDMPKIMKAARKSVLCIYADNSFGSNSEWKDVCREIDSRE